MKHEKWYKFFLILGIVGLVDIVTRSAVQQSTNLIDIGYVSYGIGYAFGVMFGASVGGGIMTILSMVFGFSIIWLLLAWWESGKIKKTKKGANEADKAKQSTT